MYGIFPLCKVYSQLARYAYSFVFFVNYFNPTVSCGIFIAYHSATVRTAIIYQDQFKIIECLSQNTVDTFRQESFHIIYGTNHAYGWNHWMTATIDSLYLLSEHSFSGILLISFTAFPGTEHFFFALILNHEYSISMCPMSIA